jgi:hypothetical protein
MVRLKVKSIKKGKNSVFGIYVNIFCIGIITNVSIRIVKTRQKIRSCKFIISDSGKRIEQTGLGI